MTGSTIHGHSSKWTSDTGWSTAGEEHIGYDLIAGRQRIIYVPAWRKICLKELGKAGFDKQPFADVGFGAGVPVAATEGGGELLLPPLHPTRRREMKIKNDVRTTSGTVWSTVKRKHDETSRTSSVNQNSFSSLVR